MALAERAEKVQEISTRAVAPLGLEVPDVVITPAGRRSVVRVLVEPALPSDDDGSTALEPVALDDVAEATQAVSAAIDADDPFGEQPYTLEVSSPGVDRPLTAREHFRRAVGRLVEFRPPEGEPFTGRVVRVDDSGIVLEDGRTLGLAEAGTGTVQVEFRR
ncbi:ribosome maturation factor RimP [Kytococcus sp. Marseille-QA3725]